MKTSNRWIQKTSVLLGLSLFATVALAADVDPQLNMTFDEGEAYCANPDRPMQFEARANDGKLHWYSFQNEFTVGAGTITEFNVFMEHHGHFEGKAEQFCFNRTP